MLQFLDVQIPIARKWVTYIPNPFVKTRILQVIAVADPSFLIEHAD